MALDGFFGSVGRTIKRTRNQQYRGSGQDRARANQANNAYTSAVRDQAYLSGLRGGGQQQQPSYSSGGGGGSRRGGGGYGYGGGGGFNYQNWQKEQEAKLAAQRKFLQAALGNSKAAAGKAIGGYNAQYGKDIAGIYAQNRKADAGYTSQITALQRQLQQQAQQRQAALAADFAGQGAGGPELATMRQAAGMNSDSAGYLGNIAQQYNQRLAAVMSQREADARAMGAGIKASAGNQLENSYLQAMHQIGMLGL